MAIISIIAVNVGSAKTTIYKTDGSSFDLENNDPRLAKLVEAVTPAIVAGQVAEYDLNSEQANNYRQFEEKTNGVVKLFRIAKKFVKHIFAEPEPELPVLPEGLIGNLPVTKAPEPVVAPTPQATKMANAASEILSRATSVNDAKFTTDEMTEDDTVIAVVQNDKGEDVIIPGMENLQQHFKAALKLGSTKGVENFLKRISTVIERRGHSIDDLLRFMTKNDMPIADDGCLVAFKTLNRRGNQRDTYQDIHSGNVVQRVGSHVFMAEKLVDPSRRNDCSNGLHVARRAYVGGFRGSDGVMVLIKVAPEDAIAVPQYDGNKMRVCGYHIVADVPAADHQTVFANRPIGADTPTAKLLAAVLRGEHIGITETVEITGPHGGGLKVKKLGSEAAESTQKKEAAAKIAAVKEGVASIDDAKNGVAAVAPVDTKAIAAKVSQAKATVATGGINASARMLFDANDFEALKALKKKAKKSYSALGFSEAEVKAILSDLVPEEKAPEPAPVVEAPVEEPKEVKKLTVAEEARKLFEEAAAGERSRWTTLWLHKKQAKKGWDKLGFSKKEIERIQTNKPDHV